MKTRRCIHDDWLTRILSSLCVLGFLAGGSSLAQPPIDSGSQGGGGTARQQSGPLTDPSCTQADWLQSPACYGWNRELNSFAARS